MWSIDHAGNGQLAKTQGLAAPDGRLASLCAGVSTFAEAVGDQRGLWIADPPRRWVRRAERQASPRPARQPVLASRLSRSGTAALSVSTACLVGLRPASSPLRRGRVHVFKKTRSWRLRARCGLSRRRWQDLPDLGGHRGTTAPWPIGHHTSWPIGQERGDRDSESPDGCRMSCTSVERESRVSGGAARTSSPTGGSDDSV